MTAQNSLGKYSHKLRYLFVFLLFFTPIVDLLFWLFLNDLPREIVERAFPVPVADSIAFLPRLLGFSASLIPLAVVMAGLTILVRLFSLYEQGIVFEKDNIRCIRNLANTLIIWFFALNLYTVLVSMAITSQNPPGQRMLAIQLNLNDLSILLTGLVLLALGKVMKMGHDMNNELSRVI